MIGFYNILEACRHSSLGSGPKTKSLGTGPSENLTSGPDPSDKNFSSGPDPRGKVVHLVYASSSSVYGGNKKVPFSTDDRVDNPVSLYAATKKSNELMAHCYSKLYDIPTTGLRFFTVYGPAGRPDMAYFEDGLPVPPYAVYNIGGGQPENLLDFVQILQEELVAAGVLPKDFDFEAHKQLVPMQPGDVPTTYADATALERDFGFTPKITLREGLREFARWYKQFYG